MELIDQLQRKLIFKETPKRIISLVPSQTELLFDMGLEDSIVGITKFCIHPNHLKKSKTIVGGTKLIKPDKIRALKPDIILCNKEENTKEIVEVCESICTVHVSDIFSIPDCIELIRQYGELFNRDKEIKQIIGKINSNLSVFLSYVKNKPVLKVAYFIWRKPWMVTGNTTFINYLLHLNGFENIFINKSRYPEIQLEELTSDLDLVLLSSEPYPFKDKHADEITEYRHHAKIIFVDGEYFSWYGSRLIKAFDYFKTLRESL